MAEPRKDSRFKEQMSDGKALAEQQIPAEAHSVDPGHQDAATPRRESPEPAQQSPPSAQQSTEPVDGPAPPAKTSLFGPYTTSDWACKTCGKLACTEHDARSELPPVDTSPKHTQAQASTPSAPQTDENVPPTKSRHIGFAEEIDNRKEVNTSEKSLPMEPDQPQTLYTAAVKRVNLATTALEKARMESVDAHVSLRSAQANADNTNPGSGDQALKDAQSAVSGADEAYQKCQSELIQAHIAQNKAKSDARLAGSVAQQSTSQSDVIQGKETWKGKGRAEESSSSSESSSSDQGEETLKVKGKIEKSKSPSADGKKTRNPLKIVGRALRRGSSNEQHSPQQPGRSQSEPTLQSPNPLAKAYVPKPNPPIVRGWLPWGWDFAKDYKGKSATTTSGSAEETPGGAQIGTTGGSTIADEDGAGDDKANSSQPVNTNNAENGTGNSQNPVNSQGTQILPAGETGKKPGFVRKMSSDLFSKMKKK